MGQKLLALCAQDIDVIFNGFDALSWNCCHASNHGSPDDKSEAALNAFVADLLRNKRSVTDGGDAYSRSRPNISKSSSHGIACIASNHGAIPGRARAAVMR